ncbi:MAG: NAD(P)H-hydrate dehydratase [Candidatus Omnitrophica bacterium]|nr:NAD(P)H-hydrate dehydratase [Candidatus Omnitrophota bacterium]
MSKIMRLPAQLLHRKIDSHKGDFGHILILAGCARFSGAAALCAEAALRSGAGLVTLGIPEGINSALIKIKPREVMTLPLAQTKEGTLSLSAYRKIKDFAKKIDIFALGPGLSSDKSTQKLVRKIVKMIEKPMVIDADGLNALVGHLDILKMRRAETIVTPHSGEMGRLINKSAQFIQNNRNTIAKEFASRYNLTIILKGFRTLVANKRNIYVNKTGNPGMSTAGCGDVLTGMTAALWAQGLDAFSAAKYAAYLHGLAGDLAAKEKTQMGMVASDIVVKIPEAIKKSS